ncbi:unnamed protein product [Caenorhabditis brenneri]
MVYAYFFVLLMMIIIMDPVVAQDHQQIDAPEFVKLLNWRRRQFAKTFRFPNMYEVKWDEKLLELAKRPYDESKMIGGNYRSYLIHHGFLGASWALRDAMEIFNEKRKNGKLESLMDSNDLGSIEFYVPGQTKIGCAPKHIHDDDYMLCLLGPESELTTMRVNNGNDGTMCNEGDTNIDGLCQWSGEGRKYEGTTDSSGSAEKLNLLPLVVLQMILFFLYK